MSLVPELSFNNHTTKLCDAVALFCDAVALFCDAVALFGVFLETSINICLDLSVLLI